MFNTSRNKSLSLSIEAMQICSRNKWRSANSLKLNSCLTDTIYWGSTAARQILSIKNYEIIIFRFDFRPILTCMYRVSFLITLDIYKAYFKDCHIREYKENICKMWIKSCDVYQKKKISGHVWVVQRLRASQDKINHSGVWPFIMIVLHIGCSPVFHP